ncbi:MAG: four helix bundle protein [Microcoleaceae cyanobacterium MO_207.B10]|nr:four helix bundle protein [Microcoleaceae cyanobacterium MO_207.B10]
MKNHISITERTFEFAVRITKLCNLLDQQPGTSRLLANQLFRSGTSIGANLAESQSAQNIKDFISKQEISLKEAEARETRYWLRLLIETNMIESERIAKLLDECEQLIKILAQSIVTSKKKAE